MQSGGTSFTFATAINGGDAYDVTISSQPSNPRQTCVVAHGTGTVGGSDITNVDVSCTVNSYTISGNVAGLSGSGLTLTETVGGSTVAIAAWGSFSFPQTVEDQLP